MNPGTLTLIINLCNLLYGVDTTAKRNYSSYVCSDTIKNCVQQSGQAHKDSFCKAKEESACIVEYIKKNYRHRK